MLNKIKCLFKGHDLRVARYKDAYPRWIPSGITKHFDGTVKITPPWISGFMHYGLYSVCERCGDHVSVDDDTKLPIIEPEFMKKAGRGA